MFSSFKKAFFPSENELEQQRKILDRLEQGDNEFWNSRGFNKQEIQEIRMIEACEVNGLRSINSYVGRRNLLESGITTIDAIKEELRIRKGE
ncbi:MAG: hypothetical protein ACQEXX_19925 [Bacillota bacterium]